MAVGPCRFTSPDYDFDCICLMGKFETNAAGVIKQNACLSCGHVYSEHDGYPEDSEGIYSEHDGYPEDSEDVPSRETPSRGTPSRDTTQSFAPPLPILFEPQICLREATVISLFQRAQSARVVYVRGTPACGKTTLGILLEDYVNREHPSIHASRMTWMVDNNRMWDEIVEYQCKIKFNKHYLRSLRNHLIIIDEVQNSFKETNFWTEFVKELHQDRIPDWPMLVMFGAYGPPGQAPNTAPNPARFAPDQRVSLRPNTQPYPSHVPNVAPNLCLYFDWNEFNDTLNRVERYSRESNLPFRLSDDLKEEVWKMTCGHPGAVRAILLILENDPSIRRFRKEDKVVPLQTGLNMFRNIIEFSRSLRNTGFGRSWPDWTTIQRDPLLSLFLAKVVANGGLGADEKNSREQEICHRKGWLHSELQRGYTLQGFRYQEVVYIFPTKLHHKLLEHYFKKEDFPIDDFGSVKDLFLGSLKHFQQNNLNQARIRTGGELTKEGRHQDEFYRACWELLGQKLYLTSDYTPSGHCGSIDFFVEELKWGIELVQEDKDLDGHIQRFLSKGRYYPWIEEGLMKEYVLVEFRTTPPKNFYDPKLGYTWLYYVVFSESNKVYTVLDYQGEQLD